jgi:hypothetical protein
VQVDMPLLQLFGDQIIAIKAFAETAVYTLYVGQYGTVPVPYQTFTLPPLVRPAPAVVSPNLVCIQEGVEEIIGGS